MLIRRLTFLLSLLLFLLSSLFQISFAQSPDTIWTKFFTTPGDDYGYYAEQTDDGGYILIGTQNPSGRDDIWLIKTDENGTAEWTKLYGSYNWDYGECVHQTSDGGYVIFGYTDEFYPAYYNGWLLKTDQYGDTLWSKVYTGEMYHFIKSGLELPVGNGYVFTGYTKLSAGSPEDIWVVRTDLNGDTVWTASFGGMEREFAFSVARADNGYLYVAGMTESFGAGESDGLVIKLTPDGDSVWAKTYGGPGSDYLYDIKETNDGGFIIAGSTGSFGHMNNYQDAWLIKINSDGDTLWTKTYGNELHDNAYSVVQTSDGCYVWTGILSFDQWNDDAWVVKTDPDGNIIYSRNYGGEFWDQGRKINLTSEGTVIIAGVWYDVDSNTRDIWLLNFQPAISGVEENYRADIPETIFLKQNYPNPFNAASTIRFGISESRFVTLAVYNLLGEQVDILAKENLPAGKYTKTWNAGNMPSGIYICRLSAGDYNHAVKMILLR